MQKDVTCFWLEPTDRVHLWLRRYVSSAEPHGKCPLPYGYHNVMVDFGEHPVRYGKDGVNGFRYLDSYDDMMPASDDPRWPTKCGCGYEFKPAVMGWCDRAACQVEFERHLVKISGDEQQVFQHQLYRRVDTGAITTIEDAPPGAMWNAWWYGDTRYPDKINLMVKLPNGSEWWVDGPAKGGGTWTRTGTIPKVTASPSIFANQGQPNSYHGWLRDGHLIIC